MRPPCHFIRPSSVLGLGCRQRRNLLTLAIETSCDDTSVAVLEKHTNNSATLHFHSKITSDNSLHRGIHPIVAHISHQKHLGSLINEAVQNLPVQPAAIAQPGNSLLVPNTHGADLRKKPDFVTVTRGPGMRANLITGIDTAKGLAVGWQVPILGINHMQAHALTPGMVSALNGDVVDCTNPEFPFLSLLVSGGHTMLVHSRGLCDHEILSTTTDLAVGDMIDKCARDILPSKVLESNTSASYGPALESFAFPDMPPKYDYHPPTRQSHFLHEKETCFGWSIKPPYTNPGPKGHRGAMKEFSFSGIGSKAASILKRQPNMDEGERQILAREVMRLAFEHLASRITPALQEPGLERVKTLVVSGGVASNQYLKHILGAILRARAEIDGKEEIQLMFPPPKFCTDNAAMIAWTGIEMWEAGWRSDLDMMALRKWAIDSKSEDGGILGVGGWKRYPVDSCL
ncbi:hypothetical protein B7494_g6394 [Chlorociboria aeruginascens]|nr:hypothetical protein B7494_g6394 [Chlorociboria aeruginascens]